MKCQRKWTKMCGEEIILWILFCGLAEATHYRQVSVENQFLWRQISRTFARSKLLCVSRCTQVASCEALHYNSSSQECSLLQLSTTSPCTSPWTYQDPVNVIRRQESSIMEYTVLRTSSGTGALFYNPWMTDSYLSHCTEDVLNMNDKINFTFKHRLLSNWTNANILEVHLTLWKDGKEVVRLVFDGRNSTKTDWFTHSRLQESSFTDLKGYKSAVMSIDGYKDSRRFYVYHSQNTCYLDKGWLCMKEDDLDCGWENQPPYPAFLYSTTGEAMTWYFHKNEIGLADDLLISVLIRV